MTASLIFYLCSFRLFAPEIVHLLLGSQWNDAISLMRILSIWALFRSIGNPIGSLLMACGRADLSFKWNLAWLFIMSPTIWFGGQFGVTGIAISMTVLSVLTYWPNWYFQVHLLCGAKLGEYSLQMAVPFLLSVVAGVAGYISAYLLKGDFVRLAVGFSIGGVIYFALSRKFNHVWFDAMLELVGKKGI